MTQKENMYHYDSLQCQECRKRCDLYKERNGDKSLCLDCINKKLMDTEEKVIQIDLVEIEVEE